MRIVCVGGGPGGLYFAILAKLSDPRHEVTILERDPAGVTYGWGVTILDDLLDDLFRKDPRSAQLIWESSDHWDEYEVRVGDHPTTYLGGYGFSMSRHRMLDILAGRARELGVEIRYEHAVDELAELPPADLVVAADGAHSRLRRQSERHFGTTVEKGRNKYIWLGTDREFDKFTFAFEQTPAGWIWFYAYPFTDGASTCIVECPPETWEALGFADLPPDETMRALGGIFARHLDGHHFTDQVRGLGRTPWLNFTWITNATWHHDRVVLVGDAAHTAHFSIGFGTKLALEDAIALAESLAGTDDVDAGLRAYEARRRVELEPHVRAARVSCGWFEDVPRHVEQPTTQFAYALWNRQGGHPPWRYQLHLAIQHAFVRGLLRQALSVRKRVRSRRRATLAAKRAQPVPVE